LAGACRRHRNGYGGPRRDLRGAGGGEDSRQVAQQLRTHDKGGSFHALSKCTIKALKLGLTLAAPGRTSDRMAKAVEMADCLRLKIKQLDTMCYCAHAEAEQAKIGPDPVGDLFQGGTFAWMEFTNDVMRAGP
jgi:hypothetical protein